MSRNQRWLYPDCELAADAGICYELQFVGSVPILVSIKSVDLATRTKIAHAAIHQVCADVGLRLPDPRLPSQSMSVFLSPETNKSWALTNVRLTITSQSLVIESLELKWLLFQHNLSTVSFASGGDSDAVDFVCYVAKNVSNDRLCYVFNCPSGSAQNVIVTLGQAFQLGFQEFKRSNDTKQVSTTTTTASTSPAPFSSLHPRTLDVHPHPDDSSHAVPISLSSQSFQVNSMDQQSKDWLEASPDSRVSISATGDDFTEFDEDTWRMNVPLIPPTDSCRSWEKINHAAVEKLSHNYINTTANVAQLSDHRDNLPSPECDAVRSQLNRNPRIPPELDRFRLLEPVGEPWYVGPMRRAEAETLLRYEGDFLVRASVQQPGQFVLSGLQDNKCRHLLLANPDGQVRTRERIFDSIQHLVDYHLQNGVPIRSADSEIRLIFPVSTHTFCEI